MASTHYRIHALQNCRKPLIDFDFDKKGDRRYKCTGCNQVGYIISISIPKEFYLSPTKVVKAAIEKMLEKDFPNEEAGDMIIEYCTKLVWLVKEMQPVDNST